MSSAPRLSKCPWCGIACTDYCDNCGPNPEPEKRMPTPIDANTFTTQEINEASNAHNDVMNARSGPAGVAVLIAWARSIRSESGAKLAILEEARNQALADLEKARATIRGLERECKQASAERDTYAAEIVALHRDNKTPAPDHHSARRLAWREYVTAAVHGDPLFEVCLWADRMVEEEEKRFGVLK